MYSTLSYSIVHYSEIDKDVLYEILSIRQEVFVVEQDCPYLDADGKDRQAYHVIGKDGHGTIQAYARLLEKGLSYDQYCSIGRVITRKSIRGKGQGRTLMQFCIDNCTLLWKEVPIKISAQAHLDCFYNSLGFVASGEAYLEDGIPHIGMVRIVSDNQ